jgi:hypothetical protein
MQKLKKHKIQEILDQQNAAIDADIVCLIFKNGFCNVLLVEYEKMLGKFTEVSLIAE